MRIAILGTGMYVFGSGVGTGTIANSVSEILPADGIIDVLGRRPELVPESMNFIHIGDIGGSNSNLIDYIETCSPDGVIISLPDHLHFSAIETCLEMNTPCLVVKPFVEELEQAVKLSRLSAAKNTGAYVEFHKRFDVQNRWARHEFLSGALGEISSINVNYSQKILIPTNIFSSWVTRTNIFQYLGVHYVDLIYWMTNFYPKKVLSVPVYGILRDKYRLNTPDSIVSHILWTCPNTDLDFMSTLNIGWVDHNNSPAMSDQRMWIKASDSSIELDQMNRGFKVSDHNGYSYPNPYFSAPVCVAGESLYQGYAVDSIRAFIAAIGGTSHSDLCDASQAVVSVSVTAAVNQSINSGSTWVEVKAQ